MPNVVVTAAIQWLDFPANARHLVIRCKIPGGMPSIKGAALFIFEFDETTSQEALTKGGLSVSEKLGPFLYISGAEGDKAFRAEIQLPPVQLRRVGVRLWNLETPLELEDLFIGALRPSNGNFFVNVSVDVEALEHRAPSHHVERLIYGRQTPGGQASGIPMEMEIFRQFNVPATFYLEFGEAASYGAEIMHEVARYITANRFDLQLHLHSEVLVRAQRWPRAEKTRPSLENLDLAQTMRALTYSVEQFRLATGRGPRAFRAGAYQFNDHTVDVAKQLGILACSNYRADQRKNNRYDFKSSWPMRPFQWSNGLYEFPITVSPEPLSALTPEVVWDRILHHVTVNKTWFVNVVIHSWSLMERTTGGHHEWRSEALANNLRRIFELAPPEANFVSMGEVVDSLEAGEIKFDLTRNFRDLVRRNDDGSLPE